MKNFYKKISYIFLLILFSLYQQNGNAKNLKCRVLTISVNNTSGGNCDQACAWWSNNQIDWVFDIDDGGTDVDERCYDMGDDNNSTSTSPNFVVWNGDFDYVCQWPTWNIDFNVEGWDQDCADICLAWNDFGSTVSDRACTVNINRTMPSDANGTYGPYTATNSYNRGFDGSGNCAGTITVTYQFEVSGSYASQASDDYICGAYNLGNLNSGATLTRNNFNNFGYSDEDICSANEPNISDGDETVWLKFKTGSTPGTNINVDVSAIGGSGSGGVCAFGEIVAGWCKVYEGPDNLAGCPFGYTSNHFTQIAQVGNTGLDLSDIDINCPKPNQTYYVQVEVCTPGVQFGCAGTCDEARFNLTVKDNGIQAGPNYICQPATSTTVGVDGYLGTLNSSFDPRTTTGSATAWNNSDYDLRIMNQSTTCANVSSGEPNNTTILSGLDNTVWYRFRTPAADYPTAPSLAGLAHTYRIFVERLGSSSTLTYPAIYLYEENAANARACGDNSTDYANLSYIDRDEIDPLNIFNGGDAELKRLCLKPNTNYYIQIDPVGGIGNTHVDFNLWVVKDQFRPSDMICDAVDLGYITTNGLQTGVTTGVNWANNGPTSKLGAAKFFGLPHTNKCTSAEGGEPNASPGGPGSGGNHTATVWYKFTTGSGIPPDWIYWYNNDNELSNANRGNVCVGLGFQSRVTFYKNASSYACPVGGNLVQGEEMNIPGDLCDATTGIGFGAPCYRDLFRLKCPEPNTTYMYK